MEWKSKGFKEIKDVINYNTGGMADEFIYPSDRNYPIQNLDVMARWLFYYIEKNYPITIFGDYDVDGICSSAELWLLLTSIGASNVRIRLPRRMSEGYGIKDKAIDEIENGILITVDNGIAAIDAVKKAKEKGLIVLVLDHHEPVRKNGEIVLPPADLIVDPAVPDDILEKGSFLTGTRFRKYCGAGLAYKLALLMTNDPDLLGKISAMAAIATVADVMPLIEDNRIIYKEGIRNIANGKVTKGLQCLVDILKSGNIVTESDIGFKIAPMLNAPGRILDEGAMLSLEAILAPDYMTGRTKVDDLNSENEKRKKMKSDAVKRAFDIIKEECMYGINPVIIFDPDTPEGIIGLVAGAITEKYDVTSIVFTEKNGTLKGSARAGKGNNIKEALDKLSEEHPEIFLGYGGHAGAAGVTIKKEYLNLFEERMAEIMPEANIKEDVISYDVEIPAGDLKNVVPEVMKYAPYGEGNPAVILRIDGFKIVPQENVLYKEMGANTVKLFGAGCEAVGFSLLERYKNDNYPTEMDIIGKVTMHYFMGKETPQIEIIDYRPIKKESKNSDLRKSLTDILKINGLAK